jgi:hypothetical protein
MTLGSRNLRLIDPKISGDQSPSRFPQGGAQKKPQEFRIKILQLGPGLKHPPALPNRRGVPGRRWMPERRPDSLRDPLGHVPERRPEVEIAVLAQRKGGAKTTEVWARRSLPIGAKPQDGAGADNQPSKWTCHRPRPTRIEGQLQL